MALAGCVEKTVPIEGLYCDATTPCKDAAQVCLLEFKVCVARDGGVPTDMGADMTPPGCMSSSECGATTPICASMSCRACSGSADDAQCAIHNSATPRCGGAGECVACRSDTQAADCTSATAPICGANNTCRGCQQNSECASGICASDGSCVPPTQIAYVDNRGMTVIGCSTNITLTRDGNSWTTAFCDVQDGVNTTKPYVLVKGSSQSYGRVLIDATRTVTIIGPGRAASPAARLFTLSQPSITIAADNTDDIVFVANGLDLGGDAVQKSSNGVVCTKSGGTANANVRLIDISVHDSSGAGVQSTECQLTIRQSTLSKNAGGGLSITSGTYTIENNLIFDNSGSGPGVTFSGTVNTASRFRFNTVAGNKRSGTNEGGVICPGGGDPFTLEHSIIFSNDKKNMKSVVGNCSMVNSFTDDAPTPSGGNFSADPMFVDSSNSNYRILSSSPAKDKVSGPGNPAFPTVDVDGNPRPRPAGGSWDIGAFEAQ
jgi:hypothetical protein